MQCLKKKHLTQPFEALVVIKKMDLTKNVMYKRICGLRHKINFQIGL